MKRGVIIYYRSYQYPSPIPSIVQDIFPSEGSDVLDNFRGDVPSYAEELKEENCCSLDNCEGDGAQILTKDIP